MIKTVSSKQKAESRNAERAFSPPTAYRLPSTASRGFTLLVAVIFMSVMLAFGLALGSFSYKQQVLASSAIQSQYAFYAADAALECLLYADQQQNAYNYASHSELNAPNALICDNLSGTRRSYSYSATQLIVSYRLSLDNGTRCADVTVYKPASGTTYLFAQGYSVSCTTVDTPSGARFSSRGIQVRYGSP